MLSDVCALEKKYCTSCSDVLFRRNPVKIDSDRTKKLPLRNAKGVELVLIIIIIMESE